MSVNNPAPTVPGPTAISIGPSNSYALNNATATPATNSGKTTAVYPVNAAAPTGVMQAKDPTPGIKKPLTLAGSPSCTIVTPKVSYVNVSSTAARSTYGRHQLPVVPLIGISSLGPKSRMNVGNNSITSGLSSSSDSLSPSVSSSILSTATKPPRIQPLSKIQSTQLSTQNQQQQQPSVSPAVQGSNKPIISLPVARQPQGPMIVRAIGCTQLQNQVVAAGAITNHQDTTKRVNNVTLSQLPTTTISITVPARSSTFNQDSSSTPYRSAIQHPHNLKPTPQSTMVLNNQPAVIVSAANTSTHKIQKVKIPTPNPAVRNIATVTTTASSPYNPFNFNSPTAPRRLQVSNISTSAVSSTKIYSQSQPLRIHSSTGGVAGSSTAAAGGQSINNAASSAAPITLHPHTLTLHKNNPQSVITITSSFPTPTMSTNSSASSKISSNSNSLFTGQIIHTGNVAAAGNMTTTTNPSTVDPSSQQQVRIIQQHMPAAAVNPTAPTAVAATANTHSSLTHNVSMSPKTKIGPNILRRPNRTHNVANEGIPIPIIQSKNRYVSHPGPHDINSASIKAVLPATGVTVGKPMVNSNGVAGSAAAAKLQPHQQQKNNTTVTKDFRIEKEIVTRLQPQPTIGEIKIKADQHTLRAASNQGPLKIESASAHLAQQQHHQINYQHSPMKIDHTAAAGASNQRTTPLTHHHPLLLGIPQPQQISAPTATPAGVSKSSRPFAMQRNNLVTVSNINTLPSHRSVYHTIASIPTCCNSPLQHSNQPVPVGVTAPMQNHSPVASSVSNLLQPTAVSPYRTHHQVIPQPQATTVRTCGVKRDYQTMTAGTDNNLHHHHYQQNNDQLQRPAPNDKSVLVAQSVVALNSGQGGFTPPTTSTGLSPRKKPRKQKHVVAQDGGLREDDWFSDRGDLRSKKAALMRKKDDGDLMIAEDGTENRNSNNQLHHQPSSANNLFPSSTSTNVKEKAAVKSSTHQQQHSMNLEMTSAPQTTNNISKINSMTCSSPPQSALNSNNLQLLDEFEQLHNSGENFGKSDEHDKVAADDEADNNDADDEGPASVSVDEYIDAEGVRWVTNRNRELPDEYQITKGFKSRPLNNHFQRYSDVKVKPEKRSTFNDSVYDENKLGLYDMGMFALQFQTLMKSESDLTSRFEKIHQGLLKYCEEVTNKGCEMIPWEVTVGEGCLAADRLSYKHEYEDTKKIGQIVPSNSISHKFGFVKSPFVVRGAVSTKIHSVPSVRLTKLNGVSSSYKQLSPIDKERIKFRSSIRRVDDHVKANIQRCKMALEQLEESKKTMLRAVGCRELVLKVIEGGRKKEKAATSNKPNGTGSSRGAKKKKGL